MKMELIDGSETSAIRTQTPGNYPKESILHTEHGESLKSRTLPQSYNNQSVNAVYKNQGFLISDPQEIHKYDLWAESRLFEC